eukprot:CAMPEP_0113934692 /NCGR_PEP_ID=MMETSP1339-20121228/1970_1 /TAXON_ID=94617 /ORGANISM="Fibrocapsa japonica" /LENGTH=167 /DNA_ID=CAMNT_0000936585 /DNA_START=26 /DNA_END=529 /DNA_ORIENTATION=- /assembly_acc=CAM_ASM_000762
MAESNKEGGPLQTSVNKIESDDQEDSQNGLEEISKITFNNYDAKVAAGNLGAISVVCSALNRHGDHEAFSAAGCKTLRNLIFKAEANKERALAEGGVGAVVEVLSKHRNSEAVCIEGTWVLGLLCANSDATSSLVDDNARALINEIKDIHSTSASVQSKCMFLQAAL